MIDLTKFEEQVDLEEARKETCLISDRTEDFKRVEATILTPEYFAHNNKFSGWTITDKASGLALKFGFRTLTDAKDYLKTLTPEEQAEIDRIKSSEKYKEQCRKLAAANMEDYKLYEGYYYSVFEALEDDGQENLNKDITNSNSQYIDHNINEAKNISELLDSVSLTDFDLTEDATKIKVNTPSDLIRAGLNNKDGAIIDDPEQINYLIDRTKQACKKFGVAESSWAYVLQLLCNAFSTERAVKAALNAGALQEATMKALEQRLKLPEGTLKLNFAANYNYVGKTRNIIYDISDRQADRPDLAGKGIKAQKSIVTDKSAVRNGGRHAEIFEYNINTVEIKTTHNKDISAGNIRSYTYHNADLVYIYSIKDSSSGILYARLKLNENTYSIAAEVSDSFSVPTIEITANEIRIAPFKGYGSETSTIDNIIADNI